jgi:hypothetical protein
MQTFKVTAIRNIGGKSEVEMVKDKNGILTKKKKPNNKVIDKDESVLISSEYSPSNIQIAEAYRVQLGKELKSNLSTDFFTIKKV